MRPVRPRFSRAATRTALAVVVAIPAAVVACSEEGETPTCPPQELFDYTEPDASNEKSVAEARARGVDAGCLTPAGTATSGPAPMSTAGSGGKGGSSGSGGKGGSSGGGGKGGKG